MRTIQVVFALGIIAAPDVRDHGSVATLGEILGPADVIGAHFVVRGVDHHYRKLARGFRPIYQRTQDHSVPSANFRDFHFQAAVIFGTRKRIAPIAFLGGMGNAGKQKNRYQQASFKHLVRPDNIV